MSGPGLEEGAASEKGSAMEPIPSTILVVDDDPDIRELLSLLLEQAGYRVVRARDGAEALERVGREMPGLILLDMTMPRMDGWQFAREFRQRHGGSVPIAVVTAAQDARRRAREVGAEGYLGKPFDLEAVLSLVARLLRAARGTSAPAEPPDGGSDRDPLSAGLSKRIDQE